MLYVGRSYGVLLVPKLMTIYKQMETTIGRFYFAGHFTESCFILLAAFWKAVLFCWPLFGRRFYSAACYLEASVFH